MKVKHLSLATTGSLLLAGAASAAFTGIEVASFDDFFANSHPNVNVQTAWNAESLDVYRIYATFDAPADVTGTFGSSAAGTPMFMSNLQNGTFYNVIDAGHHGDTHYNTAPSGPQIGSNPSHAFDTFATIGAFVNDNNTTFTPGVESGSNNFQNDWHSDSFTGQTGGWFVQGLPAQGSANLGSAQQGHGDDGVYRVLLFQATVKEGAKIEGAIGFGTATQGNFWSEFSTNVPTPGALALLGLAGLAGARRRRK